MLDICFGNTFAARRMAVTGGRPYASPRTIQVQAMSLRGTINILRVLCRCYGYFIVIHIPHGLLGFLGTMSKHSQRSEVLLIYTVAANRV